MARLTGHVIWASASLSHWTLSRCPTPLPFTPEGLADDRLELPPFDEVSTWAQSWVPSWGTFCHLSGRA